MSFPTGLPAALTALVDGVRDLAMPLACVCCGDVRGPLCDGCAPAPKIVRVGVGPLPCAAAGVYDGSLRAATIAYKERGVRTLAGPLGALLAEAVLAVAREGPVLLIPVPSTAAARRARGEDHMNRLTRSAVRRLRRRGLAIAIAPVLRVARAPAESVGLGAAERWANMAGAFGVRPSVRPPRAGRLVLVDDVVTTGATLAEAYRAAASGGMPPVAAAAVAATPLRPKHHP
jgi:predicted amidophosphoribosyltransferase